MNSSAKSKYRVKVIRSKCIGAASCVAIAPKTFKMDGEQKAVVILDGGDSDEDKLLGAQSCPTAAIEVYDKKGKKIWPC